MQKAVPRVRHVPSRRMNVANLELHTCRKRNVGISLSAHGHLCRFGGVARGPPWPQIICRQSRLREVALGAPLSGIILLESHRRFREHRRLNEQYQVVEESFFWSFSNDGLSRSYLCGLCLPRQQTRDSKASTTNDCLKDENGFCTQGRGGF